MAEDFINQILNNFLKLSKFYVKIKPLSPSLYTLEQSNKLLLSLKEPSPPYLEISHPRLIKIAANERFEIYVDSKRLCETDVIKLIGFMSYSLKPKEEAEFLKDADYYALAYYYSEIRKESHLYSLMLHRLGLTEYALKLIENNKDDKSRLVLATILTEIGDIKKAVEVLKNIESKDYEIQKNINYAWLHLAAKKPENSKKIFSYYSSLTHPHLRQEVLFGLALSSMELGEEITMIVKLLNEASNLEGYFKASIMRKLFEIYKDINDRIKALEIARFLYNSLPDTNFISTIIEAGKKNPEDLLLIYDLALFRPEMAIKISKDLDIPQNPSIIVNKESSLLVNSILQPEDISKLSSVKKQIQITHGYEIDLTSKLKPDAVGDIISEMAFEFLKELEKEFSKKIYFNLEGVDDVERKIRITSMSEIKEDKAISIFEKSSYFLLYLIRERFKAKIKMIKELDIWASQAVIQNRYGIEMITYPAARIWRFKWEEPKPPYGYLRLYVEYLNSFMNLNEEPPYGRMAIALRYKSDEEKIFDARIEHKKILEVAKDINETSYLAPNPSFLAKLEAEIRKYFKPSIPPTVDGWKILRCFAHIFLEMIIKEFSPTWYCVERNDGLWAFELPQKVFVFPVGKVYKAALTGESLEDYYKTIQRNYQRT
ncbi:MAG: hypothetical protein ACP5IO_06080 [Elusimicrobiales bacterium]